MKKLRQSIGLLCALCAVTLFSLTGCGGDDLRCGEGTSEVDGECVFEAETNQNNDDCGEGEVLWAGECVSASSLCSEGTIYDEDTQGCVPESTDPGSELDCGAGTAEANGECIPSAAACGANTTLDDQNRCIADDAIECGDNTELDPNENTCILTEETCGGTTAFDADSGSCQSTSEVCDTGTNYNAETGLCMSAVGCKAGDVILEEICVTPADALLADAEFFAGAPEAAPTEIDLKDVGESSIFAGTILEPTIDPETGEFVQHADLFTFGAEEGDWLEITTQSIDGLFTPTFILAEISGADFLLFRYSRLVTSSSLARHVAIPRTGTYVLIVQPESTLFAEGAVIGGDEWDYVGTIDKIDPPDATPHEFEVEVDPGVFETESISGTFGSLEDHFYFIDEFDAGDTILFTWEALGAQAVPVVETWATPEEHLETIDNDIFFSVEVPDSGEFYLLLDWEILIGHEEQDFELSATILTPMPDEGITHEFTAESFQVLKITQTNDLDADVNVEVVRDSDGEILITEDLDTFSALRYVWLEDGDYTVHFTDATGEGIFEFDYSVEQYDPFPLGGLGSTAGNTGENDTQEQDYHLVEFAEDITVDITLTNTGGDGWGRLFVYGANNTLIDEMEDEVCFDLGDFCPDQQTITVDFMADTPYMIRVGNDATWTEDYFFDYDLLLEESVEEEVPAAVHNIVIADSAFSPDSLTIAAGDTVIWTNEDGLTHTVTADGGEFNSGGLGQGEGFANTFNVVGDYAYNCDYHDMPATIIVE